MFSYPVFCSEGALVCRREASRRGLLDVVHQSWAPGGDAEGGQEGGRERGIVRTRRPRSNRAQWPTPRCTVAADDVVSISNRCLTSIECKETQRQLTKKRECNPIACSDLLGCSAFY